MKLKTNKLLTLTLATGLVAMTAGCGGSKTPAATTGGGDDTPNTTPPPADTVAYSDWSGSATIATVVTDNAFLAGTAATTTPSADVNLTGLPANTTVETLNLASQVAPVNGTVSAITLGGEAADGVAFATVAGTTAADSRYFAGVVAGTDLGAPVPTATATATWSNGLFQAVGATGTYATASKTFALTVTFGATDATRTITALVGANTNADAFTAAGTSYYISGTYDAAGVITGNVLYRDFSAAADDDAARTAAAGLLTTATGDTPTDPETVGLGTLSGLIGAQGALGVFYSSGSDGDGATGFAGGFVVSALPNAGGEDSNSVYADWSGSDDVTIVTTLEDNGFLASVTTDADGLVFPAPTPAPTVVTLNLTGQTHAQVDAQPGVAGTGPRTLGGVATNGVAFFTTGADATARYFAGLHFSTDLGAPITATTGSAEWNGLIQTVSGTAASQFDAKLFTLSVNFVDSEVSAHVTTDAAGTNFGIASYYLTGDYDDAGVITGTVSYAIIPNTNDGRTAATGNGTLSGLISATGAVGAFHSTAQTAAGYAGGFVARPGAIAAGAVIAALPADVAYAAWDVTAVPALTANGFLASSGTDVLTFTDLSTPVTQVKVDLSAGAGGVTFFETVDGASAFYKAGIHADTTLGQPVTASTVTGTWSGVFGAVGDAAHTTPNTTAITLAVTFGTTDGNTITALVPANDNPDTFTNAGDTSYYISGTYNAAGVITGNVLYADFATAAANDGAARTAAGTALTAATATTGNPSTVGLGTLTGLIGQSGAVGAFHSSGSDSTGATGYAGGFAVTRTAPGS